MNRTEVLAVMSVLKAAYPNFYRGISRDDAENAVNLWEDIFRYDEAGVVGLAVRDFIAGDEKGFPPAPGQLKKRLPRQRMSQMDELSPTWKRQKEMMDRYTALKQRRVEAGLPATCWDARKAGISAEEYDQLTEAAGLGDEEFICGSERRLFQDMQGMRALKNGALDNDGELQ